MSLKHFHLVFIFLAFLCAVGFAAWALLVPGLEPSVRVLGGFSGILGVALAVYGIWFWRKSKQVIT